MAESKARDLAWLRERKARMLPGELHARLQTTVARRVWEIGAPRKRISALPSRGSVPVPDPLHPDRSMWRDTIGSLRDTTAAAQLISAADELLAGRAQILGVDFTDLDQPDWENRPLHRYPEGFGSNAGPSEKLFWEISRGNMLTQLAAATAMTNTPGYATRAYDLLAGWCRHFASPVGPMWESGVELGIRMQSWTWLRRVTPLTQQPSFATDAVRLAISHHLEILLRFPSSHSSANNHRLVEAAGLLTGGCSFADLVDERLADEARVVGLRLLCEELALQVNSAGFHREQAVDYHCFVLEVAFFGLLEAQLFGLDVPGHAWATVHRMADALNAIADTTTSGPCFGDTDNSQVVQLDATSLQPTLRTLTLLGSVCGGPAATRSLPPDIRSSIVKRVVDTHLADATGTVKRSPQPTTDRLALAREGTVIVVREPSTAFDRAVWLCLRSGPLGYLPIAAHAHADLNAVELRFGAERFLVDPGTFLYGEDPALRRAFRDTANHNTVQIGTEPQARYAGPFLWGTDAVGTVDVQTLHRTAGGAIEVGRFLARHDGYRRSNGGPVHHRSVDLYSTELHVVDTIEWNAPDPVSSPEPRSDAASDIAVRSHFLIDGSWTVTLTGFHLEATTATTTVNVELDRNLTWTIASRAADGAGWRAPSYGHVVPATSLTGQGHIPMRPAETTFTTHFAWKRRPT